ncbi:hypothetical protein OVA24_17440 [Luteolibacter sp. SL250]|uniref:hypothetical protein n=1 Tax=Luteolibacter sp. SL250 TaxID=2995170 RepID=UPI00226ED2C4|nr:hypothetical protein [Luteolibacter sp. SL250]WAC19016.1 hypothetical protein OVA24_17440 [Luteolibacter sp. SL250]
MSSVIARRIRSAPHRPAGETWQVISDLLCHRDKALLEELGGVAGIVASTIVDKVPKEAPIIVIGKGPRIRFYCLYGDEAVTGDDANEDALPVKPLEGSWEIHVPFPADELDWAQGALKKKSTKIKAYDSKAGIEKSGSEVAVEAASIPSTSIDLDALNRL